MKRIAIMVLTGILALSVFTGCGQKEETSNENNQLPNPFTVYETLDDAREGFGQDFLVPNTLPEGYTISQISIADSQGSSFVQIIYSSGEGKITYRVGEGSQELNGDFNQYDNQQTILVGEQSITTNGNGDTISNASWEKDGYSYWVSASPALTVPEFTSLVESIQ